jgi:hypothetical protein
MEESLNIKGENNKEDGEEPTYESIRNYLWRRTFHYLTCTSPPFSNLHYLYLSSTAIF